MIPMGKPTRLPAFNKPAGPDPKMDQRLDMLKKIMAERRLREQALRAEGKRVGGVPYVPGKARGVPKLPVDRAFRGMG